VENLNIVFGRSVGETRNAVIVMRNSEALVGVTIARRHTRALTRGFEGHCRSWYQSLLAVSFVEGSV
jgi:hypothetical protein